MVRFNFGNASSLYLTENTISRTIDLKQATSRLSLYRLSVSATKTSGAESVVTSMVLKTAIFFLKLALAPRWKRERDLGSRSLEGKVSLSRLLLLSVHRQIVT